MKEKEMTKRRIDTYAQHKNEMIARRKRQLEMKPGVWATSMIRFDTANNRHVNVPLPTPYSFEEWKPAQAWGKYIPAGERCNVKPTKIKNRKVAANISTTYGKIMYAKYLKMEKAEPNSGKKWVEAMIGTTMSVINGVAGIKSPSDSEGKPGEYLNSGGV